MLRKSVRILLLLVAAAALSTLLSSATFVAHPRDGVGPDICNATGVIYLHREYNTIEPYAPHKLARGYCHRTLEISWHIKKCADCAYSYPGDYPLACRIIHAYCPTEILSPCKSS